MELETYGISGISIELDGAIKKYKCEQDSFANNCYLLKNNLRACWLIDIIVVDNTITNKGIEVRYLFFLVEMNEFFIFTLYTNRKNELPSITDYFNNARHLEQEAQELFGLNFNKNYLNQYFSADNKVFPMLKDELRKPTPKDINFSDDHFFQIEHPFKFNQNYFHLEANNQIIEKCFLHSGFFHTGLEKVLESMSSSQAYYLVESFFSTQAISWSNLLSMNIESSFDSEIPDRGKAIRMIILEFSRVVDHILFFRELCFNLRVNKYYELTLIWLKRVQSLFVSYSGNEFVKNAIRPGGVIRDISQAWQSRAIDEINSIESELLDFYYYIQNSSLWKETLDIKLVNKKQCASYNLSGPIARSVGLNIDYRKINPILFYDEVEFDIPIGTSGSIYDNFAVRSEEVFQSFKIITQLIDNLPTGRICSEEAIDFFHAKQNLATLDENKYKEKVTNLFDSKDLDSVTSFEGGNGLKTLTTIMSGSKMSRVKFQSNDSFLKVLFEQTAKGRHLNTLDLVWSAFNIEMKNVER